MLPFSFAVGDTFGIIQGSVETNTPLYFKVYSMDGEYLHDSFEIRGENEVYALSITIPYGYTQVYLVPIINSVPLDQEYILQSGETLTINLLGVLTKEKTPSSSSSSTFKFQPDDYEEKIEDISRGEIEKYEEEINRAPIPKIVEENSPSTKKSLFQVQEEQPTIIVQEKSFMDKLDELFIRPMMLITLGVVACILLLLIIKRERGSKYL